MNTAENSYLNLLSDVLTLGQYRKPEGEEGRYELFSQMIRCDLSNNKIPLLTTKKVNFKALAHEMLWFLSGSQDISYLKENKVKIWDVWANDKDEVGPLYGYQWRHWHVDPAAVNAYGGVNEIDQMAQVMQSLRLRPEARSHVVTAWRPDHLKLMSIKPCHVYLQFYRYQDEISLHLTQRSCDLFLGVPFNLAQYSLLAHMVAHQLDCKAKEFVWHGVDTHIYENHVEQVKEQLSKPVFDAPKLKIIRKPPDIFSYRYNDFFVIDYEHGRALKGDVSPQGQPGQGVSI